MFGKLNFLFYIRTYIYMYVHIHKMTYFLSDVEQLFLYKQANAYNSLLETLFDTVLYVFLVNGFPVAYYKTYQYLMKCPKLTVTLQTYFLRRLYSRRLTHPMYFLFFQIRFSTYIMTIQLTYCHELHTYIELYSVVQLSRNIPGQWYIQFVYLTFLWSKSFYLKLIFVLIN